MSSWSSWQKVGNLGNSLLGNGGIWKEILGFHARASAIAQHHTPKIVLRSATFSTPKSGKIIHS